MLLYATDRSTSLNKDFHGNSLDKLRHPRSDAYSAEQVLLNNKQQIWCGGPDLYTVTVVTLLSILLLLYSLKGYWP